MFVRKELKLLFHKTVFVRSISGFSFRIIVRKKTVSLHMILLTEIVAFQ